MFAVVFLSLYFLLILRMTANETPACHWGWFCGRSHVSFQMGMVVLERLEARRICHRWDKLTMVTRPYRVATATHGFGVFLNVKDETIRQGQWVRVSGKVNTDSEVSTVGNGPNRASSYIDLF